MVRYICPNCRFYLEAEKAVECPYCGKRTLEKERDAEELLDEIDKILKE
jgi:DNA-directed RNA polymerase subunit RPC12/RpoP